MIELLAVLAVIGIVAALVIPNVTGVGTAGKLTKAGYDIAGILQTARTYAVANNTYVWVGFFEEDYSNQNQLPAKAGVGRLVVCAIASRDGTSIYSQDSAMNQSPPVGNLTPAGAAPRVVQIGKLLKCDNIHVVTIAPQVRMSPSFAARPGARLPYPDPNRVGVSGGSPLLFAFQHPFSGTARYPFGGSSAYCNGIVQFNPQGEAISETGPVPGVAPCKEIMIQTAHGSVPDSGANLLAIDIAGMTGQITIFRQ